MRAQTLICVCLLAALPVTRTFVRPAVMQSRSLPSVCPRVPAGQPPPPSVGMISRGDRRALSGNHSKYDDDKQMAGTSMLRADTGVRGGTPPPPLAVPEKKLDEMRAQAGVLRTRILKQQEELRRLEHKIEQARSTRKMAPLPAPINSVTQTLDRTLTKGGAARVLGTFWESVRLVKRKLERVRAKRGPENRRWDSVGTYLSAQASTAVRIGGKLAQDPSRLVQVMVLTKASLVLAVVLMTAMVLMTVCSSDVYYDASARLAQDLSRLAHVASTCLVCVCVCVCVCV